METPPGCLGFKTDPEGVLKRGFVHGGLQAVEGFNIACVIWPACKKDKDLPIRRKYRFGGA